MLRSDSAGRKDYTASVPTELLLHTLSAFSFEELLPVLAVSRRWRSIAIDSGPYWSFIKLECLTAAAVNLFVTRISRAQARPVALDVFLRFGDRHSSALQALKATVLSALRYHMHHTLRLELHLCRSDAPELWKYLDVAAPQLRHLSLYSDCLDRDNLPVAPAGLFSGVAPLLRSVILVDIYFPGQPLPVFSKVTKLQLIYCIPVFDVFLHFPALESVEFPYGVSFQYPAFRTSQSYLNIRNCVWRSGRVADLLPLPLAPTRDVECVTIYNPQPEDIRESVGHLRAPIGLRYRPNMEYPEQEFELLFTELDGATKRRRVIIDVIETWMDAADQDLQTALSAALAGKLHTLDIDAAQWDTFARSMPVLPGLHRIRLNVSGEGDVAALPRERFQSRDLDNLELVAERCLWIEERDIVDFAVATFDAIALAETTLLLDNIHLRGSSRELGKVFKAAQFVHSGPCRP